jgi:DNA adenine methylase
MIATVVSKKRSLPREASAGVADAGPRPRGFVKWAGSKRQLLPELVRRIPRAWRADHDQYYEPFVGAGALYWELAPRRAHLGDLNPDLVTCWTTVRDDSAELIALLGKIQEAYRKDPEGVFLQYRSLSPHLLSPVERASRFIFLNKTCFNGLYRVNSKGVFNVPWGKNPRATICDADNLEACARRLQDSATSITLGDFSLMRGVPRGSLVYLDPPFSPITKTSNFTSFTAEKFCRADQERLVDYAVELAQLGAHVIASQSCDEEVVDLYRSKGFRCDLVPAVRAICCRGYGRGTVGEYIIRSGGPR